MVKRLLCMLLALLMCASLLAMLVSCDETPTHTAHTYGSWEVFRAASCEAGGIDVRYCSCGAYETRSVAAEEHTYDEAYLCTACGEQHTHDYGEWVTVVAATCGVDGTRMRVCACGLEQKLTLAATNAHTYGSNGKCTVCGAVNSAATVRVDDNGVRWAEDEWGYWREYDNLPELDYGGEPISFLYWTGNAATVRPEFRQTEEVDDDYLSSIYKRNKAIMDRLGVELVFTPEPGDAGSMETFVARVARVRDAETHDFDLIASYSRAQGALLSMGLSQNLTAIEDSYIELDKPWWPQGLSNLAIKNNLYFVTGEMSPNTIAQMHCIYFNKDLVNEQYAQEAFGYFAANAHVKTPETEDTATNMLYEKVYAGKWTLDDLLVLSSSTYIDTRGDGVTSDDTFGLCSIYYCVSAFYGASNLRMIESTTDGTVLKISDDWTSNKTVKLVAKLNSLFATNSYHNNNTTGKTYFYPFINGRSYFALYYMRMAEDYLLNNDKVENYGVLPVPKYDINQRNYYTVVGNEFSIYSVFSDFDARGNEQATLSMLSAVLECWASEAYRKTTPVIFEQNLRLKSLPTQCERDMCEIIRASVTFDLGRILSSVLYGTTNAGMDGEMATAAEIGTSWGTVTNSDHLNDMKGNLADFVDMLQRTLV